MFLPRYCPHSTCPSRQGESRFHFHRHGFYRRRCDGLIVPRFRCLDCGRRFSRQTFRGNYRYRLPSLDYRLVALLCSKVTRRQAARVLGVDRKTVDRRLTRMARICRDFHAQQLRRCAAVGGLRGVFQLDELETFEQNRKVKPLTMAVLIERRSYFVLHAAAGTLPSRRPLKSHERRRRDRSIREAGVRRSESRRCVQLAFQSLARVIAPRSLVRFQSDQKSTYPVELRRALPHALIHHQRLSGKARRDYRNPLFPINHTLAMMRDGVSCLVRRSWAACKRRTQLEAHVWLWIAYRNYVRGVTVKTATTPAQSAGVCRRAWSFQQLLYWRWPLYSLGGQPIQRGQIR